MEKLNELVELGKKATGGDWTTNSRNAVVAVDDQANSGFVICAASGCDKSSNAAFIAAANPETILAIAEAFRTLEQENIRLKQGCENNPLVHEMTDWRERAEAAEAKLAEMEKQEPRHFYREHNSYNGMKTDWTEVSAEQLKHLKEIIDPETAEIIELFTRPALAVSLAPVSNCLSFFASVIKSGESWSATCQREMDAAREALRNIEEAK